MAIFLSDAEWIIIGFIEMVLSEGENTAPMLGDRSSFCLFSNGAAAEYSVDGSNGAMVSICS